MSQDSLMAYLTSLFQDKKIMKLYQMNRRKLRLLADDFKEKLEKDPHSYELLQAELRRDFLFHLGKKDVRDKMVLIRELQPLDYYIKKLVDTLMKEVKIYTDQVLQENEIPVGIHPSEIMNHSLGLTRKEIKDELKKEKNIDKKAAIAKKAQEALKKGKVNPYKKDMHDLGFISVSNCKDLVLINPSERLYVATASVLVPTGKALVHTGKESFIALLNSIKDKAFSSTPGIIDRLSSPLSYIKGVARTAGEAIKNYTQGTWVGRIAHWVSEHIGQAIFNTVVAIKEMWNSLVHAVEDVAFFMSPLVWVVLTIAGIIGGVAIKLYNREIEDFGSKNRIESDLQKINNIVEPILRQGLEDMSDIKNTKQDIEKIIEKMNQKIAKAVDSCLTGLGYSIIERKSISNIINESHKPEHSANIFSALKSGGKISGGKLSTEVSNAIELELRDILSSKALIGGK